MSTSTDKVFFESESTRLGLQSSQSGVSENTRATLALARETRKRAEVDAQLLTNRIALLRQEEAKAAKRIAQAKAQTAAAVKAREEHETRQRLREEAERAKLEQLHAKRERLKESKAPKTDERRTAKVDAVRATRTTREAARAALAEAAQTDQQRLRDRAEFFRKQRLDARRRVDGERVAKLRLFRLDYVARIAEEETVGVQTQTLVADLEREELALIQRLQNIQQAEVAATSELQRVKVDSLVRVSARSSKSAAPHRLAAENHGLAN